MDLAPIIAWSVPAIGLLLAIAIGVAGAKSSKCIGWFVASGIAFVLGFVLMFFQVFLSSVPTLIGTARLSY
jgi:predicted benzoate:H+ symporter BenE